MNLAVDLQGGTPVGHYSEVRPWKPELSKALGRDKGLTATSDNPKGLCTLQYPGVDGREDVHHGIRRMFKGKEELEMRRKENNA